MKKLILRIGILQVFIFSNSFSQAFWEQTNGPYSGGEYAYVRSLVINSSGYIYAATDDGIYLSTDRGEQWIVKNNGLDHLVYNSLAVNSSDDIFAGTFDSKICRSTDSGENWEHLGLYARPLISSIAINKDDVVFVGTFGMGEGGVFRSTDNGNTWQQVNSGLETTDVFCIAINSNDELFAGTRNRIKRSTDNGNTWININYIFPSSGVADIAINSNDVIFAGTFSGLFRSTDDGNSWIGVNKGLSDSSILDLAINSNDLIFAGINFGGGAFFSSDNGDNWQEINAGLTTYSVSTFTLDSSGFIYVGTIGQGVFRSVNSTITEIKNTASMNCPFYLIQNYPNPFNPTTKIKYQLPELSKVKLTVYDVLGREVQTLVNEEKSAGNYEVEFNGTDLPSGVYFYKIESGNFSDTKKIVLLK